jgi:hypothetical protein
MVAHPHGQVLNFAELARSLGSSEPTARRSLDILSGTCVVRQLPPWFQILGKRQLRSPKVYIRDAGLLHTLLGIANPAGLQSHPKLGASWEGFCLENRNTGKVRRSSRPVALSEHFIAGISRVQVRIFSITRPCTSVSRKSRPPKR